MPIAATYISGTSFGAANDLTGEFSVGVRVKCDCGEDGILYGTVTSSSYDTMTTVNITLDSGSLTSNLTGVQHGNDTPGSLVNHGHTGQADGGYITPVYTGTDDPVSGDYPAGSIYIKYTA